MNYYYYSGKLQVKNVLQIKQIILNAIRKPQSFLVYIENKKTSLSGWLAVTGMNETEFCY